MLGRSLSRMPLKLAAKYTPTTWRIQTWARETTQTPRPGQPALLDAHDRAPQAGPEDTHNSEDLQEITARPDEG
jgi:hypothetical protein